jgi:beta-1,4-mannooligosaccharide/beta-1,4-mannosyl-N-acetylglucosamine phosphorylase
MEKYKSFERIVRCESNPVMSSEMVPYETSLTFNAAVAKYQGRYVMLFRNDYGVVESDYADYKAGKRKWPELSTNIGIAFSDNGIDWQVQPEPCYPIPLDDEITHVYDPRLTVIDGRCCLCFAVATPHGVRGGIALTDDFYKYELMNLTVPDNRNMVVFPEKINGNYVRLERPFPIYGRRESEAFDIWISDSPDLRYWGQHDLLLGTENVPFCNCKIGPAAPPVKTEKGWLVTTHAVWKHEDKELASWHGDWHKEYFAGIMLLDLEDPRKIIGMSHEPLLVSEADYEVNGFRGNVIFPGGMILEDSGEVKIYYGAADTVECLATVHVDDLLSLCGA